MKNYKNILITGASSGIGRALAIRYSELGTNLFLVARDKSRLLEVKNICRGLNANVFCSIADVRDEEEMKNLVNEIEKNYRLDLVIANAGISAGTLGGIESNKQIREIFSTNLDGVLNTINPVIDWMKKRKRGQIAIVSSLAGLRGLPSSPAYSASKAAVMIYGQALRGSLAEFGITTSVVCPGYIKTPMTDVNDFYMPFLMSDKKCAAKIFEGLDRKKSLIAFPLILYFLIRFTTILPSFIADKLFLLLPKKRSMQY